LTESAEAGLFDHVAKVWEDFTTRHIHNAISVPPGMRSALGLNERFLVEAIQHAVIDMERMKILHLAEKPPDRHKYAGFLSKWIAKIRPIYIHEADEYDSSIHQINAFFALWVFQSFLKSSVPENLVEYLIYIFHFRDEKGESLALLAFCCEDMGRLGETVTELQRKVESLTQENTELKHQELPPEER
jgi:hypothetical protein